MNLLNTHNHRLVFNLNEDAPKKYIEKWNEFKLECESGDNKHIVEKIKEYSKLEINQNLHYLERAEGGLGGNNNGIHKQIRFRHIFMGQQFNGGDIPYYKKDTNIIFNEIISTNIEKWTYDDLDDLIYAFIKTANYNVGSECVTGYIEMRNKTMFSEIYLDSDSE
tara:strand:+ start:352 stop:846 length:495 start_codon:yes stop_codon:yes gene_type:complete